MKVSLKLLMKQLERHPLPEPKEVGQVYSVAIEDFVSHKKSRMFNQSTDFETGFRRVDFVCEKCIVDGVVFYDWQIDLK